MDKLCSLIRVALILSLAACDGRVFSDEGVWLGQRIGEAAQKLRASPDSVMVFEYSPAKGVDQQYSVGVGASKWCPSPGCPGELSGLTVSVERGHHGSTTVHKRYVAVPAALLIEKNGAPTQVVLRRRGDVIELVALR
jgi:hypothetical protein